MEGLKFNFSIPIYNIFTEFTEICRNYILEHFIMTTVCINAYINLYQVLFTSLVEIRMPNIMYIDTSIKLEEFYI